MSRFLPGRIPRLAAFLAVCLATAGLPARAEEQAVRNPAPSGRFLYAGDDDWDWATPLGADEPSKLARYGAMPWSALDWAEDGLPNVRGALVGTAPDPKKTMTMDQLSALRGGKATYTHHAQGAGVIQRLLKSEDPPNLIILMQNNGRDGALEPACITALTGFVKGGGRVVVLDDWKKYPPVLDAFVETALKLPPGPALQEAPAPRQPDPAALLADLQKPAPDPAPKDEDQPIPTPEDEALKKRFTELVAKLGVEEFKVREEATTAIRELGPKVLDLIKEVDTDDPEVASRLAAIREALSPKPIAQRPPAISKEEQLAQRLAKIEASAKLVTDADQKLRQGKATHDLCKVLVDGDQRLLPVLRLSFPPPGP